MHKPDDYTLNMCLVSCTCTLTSYSGIACNKLLAKLISGVHKPDDQTILPPPEAWVSCIACLCSLRLLHPPLVLLKGSACRLLERLAAFFEQFVAHFTPKQAFLEPLPVRALPGVGYKLAQQLAGLGVSSVAELRRLSLQTLTAHLGDSLGEWQCELAPTEQLCQIAAGGLLRHCLLSRV